MSAEIVVNALLRADATVSTLVGNRIAPIMVPQGHAYPYITYQRISTERVRCTEGPSLLAQALVQINIYDGRSSSEVYASVRDIADAVRKALDGYAGTVNGVTCKGISLDGERDTPAFPGDGGSQPIAGVQMDFAIWYHETPVNS